MQGSAATPLLLDPRQYWSELDRHSRLLTVSVGASVLLHVVLLSIHFGFPDALRWKSANQPLEVVLVNAKGHEKPERAKALAQANLDGGGNTSERRRATSPLPVTSPREPGRSLAETRRRQRELEAQQQKLLAQTREQRAAATPEGQKPTPDEASPESGRDMADRSLAMLQLQAQIDRQTRAYQERPRKRFIGANTREYRFAQYEDEWRSKIERVGTLNYPPEARGKLYGTLRLTVTVRPDGTVDSIELDRSSGLKVLDQAAFRIVKLSAPFAVFPDAIRKDTDLLVITRTWFFAQGDRIWTEAQ